VTTTAAHESQAAAGGRVCGICGRQLGKRPVDLNNVEVCRPCRRRFISLRQIAFIIDLAVLFALIVLAEYLVSRFCPPRYLIRFKAVAEFGTVLPWVVFLTKDGYRGLSIGKWICGLRVVDYEARTPAGFMQSLKRNMPLLLTFWGVLGMWLTLYAGRRWGDGWARTVVIWRKHARKPPFDPRGVYCLHCEYDLTGNLSGVCPECGTPIPVQRVEQAL
jgi:uncharacterized RDD family membrane protein YckC